MTQRCKIYIYDDDGDGDDKKDDKGDDDDDDDEKEDDKGDDDDDDDEKEDDKDDEDDDDHLASGYWASAGWLAMWEMVRPLETSTPR